MVLPTRTFQTISGSPVTTIEGSSASDVLGGVNISKNLRINGKDGYDQLTLAAKKASELNAISVYGNAGNDIITTASIITGSLIQGGGDADFIQVSDATTEVTVRGGSENDQISGLTGGTKLILNGNKGYDTLRVAGTFINSSIHGGDSDDRIIISSGILDATHIKGDKGNDTITDDGVANDLTFRNGSKIYGDDGNDLIAMTAANKSVVAQGGSGNDTMAGGKGADILNGGEGNDLIAVGISPALDNLQGGKGLDQFNIVAGWFLAGETIDGGDGIDTLRFINGLTVNDTHFTNKTSLERIVLDNKHFTNNLTLGTNAAASFSALNVIGGTGIDIVNAAALGESITISGNNGNDILQGGVAADRIDGGADNDEIHGGKGNDTIILGTGDDQIFMTGAWTGTAGPNFYIDTVTNFTAGRRVGFGAGFDKVGSFKLSEFGQATSDIILGNAKTGADVVANNAVAHADFDPAAGGADLNTADGNIVLITGNYTEGTLQTAMRGVLAGSNVAADDGFLIAWDNNTHTTIGVLRFGAAENDGDAITSATIHSLITLNDLADAQSLVDGNFDNFVA